MIGCILILCKYQGRNAKTPSAPCKDKSQCLNGNSKLNSDLLFCAWKVNEFSSKQQKSLSRLFPVSNQRGWL